MHGVRVSYAGWIDTLMVGKSKIGFDFLFCFIRWLLLTVFVVDVGGVVVVVAKRNTNKHFSLLMKYVM